MASESQSSVLNKSEQETQQSTSLNSKKSLLERLNRGADVRARFVDSNVSKLVAFQVRALREKEKWSQQRLAEKIESNQNAIYRAENPNYGKHTVTTLKKIAAVFDVALIVRFVPFSELIDWVTETPHIVEGLTPAALTVPSFSAEIGEGVFEQESMLKKLTEGAAKSADTSKAAPTCTDSGIPDPVITSSSGAMRAAQMNVSQLQ